MSERQIKAAMKLREPHMPGNICGVVRVGKSYYYGDDPCDDPELQTQNCMMNPAPWFTEVLEAGYLERPFENSDFLGKMPPVQTSSLIKSVDTEVGFVRICTQVRSSVRFSLRSIVRFSVCVRLNIYTIS